MDLHNLLNFLHLRADPHAQYEIRVYAETILDQIVKLWVPLSHEAFLDYRLNARTLSSQAIQMVRRLVSMQLTAAEAMRRGSGIGHREWDELMEVLGLRDEPDTETL